MPIRKPIALLAFASLALTACGGEAPKTDAAPPAESKPAASAVAAATGGTASIKGKVSFEGTVPATEKIKVTADPKCAAQHPNGLERQVIQVRDGGLANVFLYVKSGVSGSYSPPATPAMLDQSGCTYIPHIVAMQAGQTLTIRNSDDTLHNIHPRPTLNTEFNIGQPRKGMESNKSFDKPEVWIPVGCDVHPWMRAYVAVVPHPFFAVTGEDGSFEIRGLPAGEYEIEAVHEKLERQSQKVTVKDGEAATLTLTFKG
jgi:hypothetical protein